MASAKSENGDLKKILNHLIVLDEKVDKEFQEAMEFRGKTEGHFVILDQKVDDGLKKAAEFRQKTEGGFANLIQEMGGIGSMLYDKIDNNHKEFLKFQQETFFFQKRTEDFQQQTLAFQQEMRIFKQQALDFQAAMQITIQHITRVLEKIERNLSILEDAYEQLKSETERLKNENAAQNATIKKLEQRIAQLEAAQSLH